MFVKDVPQGADLLKAVDAAIAEMQKDGTLKALSEKWFGADVTK